MHSEVIRETNEFFNNSGVKENYIKFLIFTGLAAIGAEIVLSIFNIIPFLGVIIVYAGGFIINSCLGVFCDVSTYKAFSEGRAPEFMESFQREIKDGQGDIVRWIILNLSIGAVVLVIGILVAIISVIFITISVSALNIIVAFILSVAVIVVNVNIGISLNYIFFFLADSRFDSYGPIQLIKKCYESMKDHVMFYLIETIKRSIPVLVAWGIVAVIGIVSIAIDSGVFMRLSAFLLFAVTIFSIIYNVFFVIPYIKILSFNLYNSNLRDEF